MIVEILPIAQDDVDQAVTYIAADDPAAADQLYDDILGKLNQVSQHPLFCTGNYDRTSGLSEGVRPFV